MESVKELKTHVPHLERIRKKCEFRVEQIKGRRGEKKARKRSVSH